MISSTTSSIGGSAGGGKLSIGGLGGDTSSGGDVSSPPEPPSVLVGSDTENVSVFCGGVVNVCGVVGRVAIAAAIFAAALPGADVSVVDCSDGGVGLVNVGVAGDVAFALAPVMT
jgi:hypothetical protein